MKQAQLKDAIALASTQESLDNEDISVFDGFGLPSFKPVFVSLRQIARLCRWQAQYLNGQWDQEALQDILLHGRKKFIVV